jgi:hypothetical protein
MSSVELGWRKFNFFEKHPIYDPADKSQKFSAFKVNIHCLFVNINQFPGL